jgi:hypothetical protein
MGNGNYTVTLLESVEPETSLNRLDSLREGEGDEGMKEENKSHLEAIMKKFDQKLAQSTDAKERRESEEDAFYIEFKRIRTQIIRPALEEVGKQLKPMGHNYEITEVGDERSKRDAKITMSITLGGVPTSAYTPENTVSISFFHTGHTTISIHASTPIRNRSGFAGPRGNHAASEITTDLVQKTIIQVLEEVFRPG